MSKHWKRVIEVRTNGLKITNAILHIEFEVPFDDDHLPNTSVIRIYNLVHDTRAKIKEGKRLTLTAGYEGDTGIILDGEVTKVRHEKVGTDRATIIRVVDHSGYEGTNKKRYKKTYKKGVKAETIVRDLLSQAGIKVKVLDLPNNKTFKKGHSVSGKILDSVVPIIEDCGASFYYTRGNLYIRDIKKGDNINFTLGAETGLIGSPEVFTKKYQKKMTKGFAVESLLQHRISTAAIITIKTKSLHGKYRVIGGKHQATKDDFKTTIEVVS